MNSKTILAISIAGVFAISMIVSQSALAGNGVPGYLSIDKTSVTYATEDGETFFKATVKTDGKIPKQGKNGEAFGIGFLTDGGNNVLAATGHICASDSPHQGNAPNKKCPNPVGLLDEEFTRNHDGARVHPHVLDLKPYTQACKDATGLSSGFEVDVQSSLDTNGGLAGVSPDYKIHVHGKTIRIGNVPAEVLGNPEVVPTIVAFTITGVASGSTLTNLCLDVVGDGVGL